LAFFETAYGQIWPFKFFVPGHPASFAIWAQIYEKMREREARKEWEKRDSKERERGEGENWNKERRYKERKKERKK